MMWLSGNRAIDGLALYAQEFMNTVMEATGFLVSMFLGGLDPSQKGDILMYGVDGVGGILVPCANRLYGPVLTLWMYHARYESGILQSGCFFDQISRSTPKPAVDIS